MQDLLETGLKQLGLVPTIELCSSYLAYIELLVKWNKTYNLTAIKEPGEMVFRHVLDSLSVHPYINGEHCLDVGTGPGLPGLILALAQPTKHWTLLDSNQKKIRFLRHVQAALELENIDIVQSRVEDHQNRRTYSTIICRAFSSLRAFHDASHHLLDKDGQLLAMKAHVEASELSEVEAIVKNIEIKKLDVPGGDTTRCLVVMSV